MIQAYWQRLASRIDRLSVRERVISFAMAALLLVTLANTFLIDPQYAEQKKLSNNVKQDQATIAALQSQIQRGMTQRAVDKDAPAKARLKQLTDETTALQTSMRDRQKGLVSPDRMVGLLEGVLNQSGRLKLVSLRTLPVSNLNAVQAQPAAGAAAPVAAQVTADSAAAARAIYKHGVEITVRGNYVDMLAYLAKLESMPWQLFWGKAQLIADEYPDNTLTLILYTLSLDKAWLSL